MANYRKPRGIVNGDPGKRTLGEAYRAAKSAQGGEDDGVVYQWEDRKVAFVCSNGWTIERIRCEKDAAKQGELGKNCVGGLWNHYRPNPEGGQDRYAILSLREPSGKTNATILLASVPYFNDGRNDYKAYFSAQDFPKAIKPMLMDGEEWYLLECKGTKEYNTTASQSILDLVYPWYQRNIVVNSKFPDRNTYGKRW